MFANLRSPKNLTQYTLMRGTTDFGNLAQFNLFESGYSYFTVVSVPAFMDNLANTNGTYKALWETYLHILEFEFRGLDGIENIQAETSEITNNISTLNMITKVTQQSSMTFQMRFQEKSGTVLTKVHELFLKGIKDPRTQYKHYNGLIQDNLMTADYENEVFSFLYFVTDNTGTELEKAFYLMSAQPTSAELSIFNSEKGDIGYKEVGVEFNAFLVENDLVDAKAKAVMNWIHDKTNPKRVVYNSDNFPYTGISNIGVRQGVK